MCQADSDHPEDLILNGTILDNTMTPWGAQFYRAFSRSLHDQEGLRFDLLVVDEKPYTRGGSLIVITYHTQIIYRTVVFAGTRHLDVSAEKAGSLVYQALMQSQLDALFFGNSYPELDGRSDL